MSRAVVYTCLFGYSEAFNDFPVEGAEDTDLVCFTDNPRLRSDIWNIVCVGAGELDAPRRSKHFKHLPHRVLRDYDSSLYVDNVMRLKRPVQDYFRTLSESGAGFLAFRHPERNCIYAEAEAVLSHRFDDVGCVVDQMTAYRRAHFPPEAGLAAANFILRRHFEPDVIGLGEAWHELTLRYSFRDQLSLNFAAWSRDFDIGYIEASLRDEYTEGPIIRGARLPRWFDEAAYARLVPGYEGDLRERHLAWLTRALEAADAEPSAEELTRAAAFTQWVRRAIEYPRAAAEFLGAAGAAGAPRIWVLRQVCDDPSAIVAAAATVLAPMVHPEWYRFLYPDVAEAGIDPAVHFCSSGYLEGRAPNPDFFDHAREPAAG